MVCARSETVTGTEEYTVMMYSMQYIRAKQYPDSYPYPACLVLGVSTNNEYLHIVAGCNGNVVCIVTAYFPDSDKFESDSQTRKEK